MKSSFDCQTFDIFIGIKSTTKKQYIFRVVSVCTQNNKLSLRYRETAVDGGFNQKTTAVYQCTVNGDCFE